MNLYVYELWKEKEEEEEEKKKKERKRKLNDASVRDVIIFGDNDSNRAERR